MELSTRYDPHATEDKWYPRWQEAGNFHADENSERPPYSIVIPPPNVTGILHMGHALNNTLQDVLIRWKRMAGFNALWLPGTDHAGIATQNMVERALLKQKLKKKDLGREKFVERVWEWRHEYGGIIISQLKRLGCSCDWQRERFTMDAGLSRAVRTVFKRLYDEKLVYKDNYLINWCPRCLTTLADDEVDYADSGGQLWYLRYPVEQEPGKYAVVATTRPETMLGDTAVAVNPADERYRDWIGKHVILPLVNRRIPIIADDFVDRDFGTGMVKITPAHDPNDYQAGKRHGLEEINIFTPDARINEVAPAYQGLDRYEARARVVADLESQGYLLKSESYAQRVGHCYRCNTVIEPYVSLQWFVRIRPLAEPAKQAVRDGRVRFHPKSRERDYFHWLDNVRDWPISRQLWWGHRIPAWYCPCGEVIVTDADKDPDSCPNCGRKDLTQDPDVLDTWFSSSLWPFSTLGWPDKTKDLEVYYPTSTLVTAKDIIFFWVARMIMMGMHFMDKPPFHEVYFNPIVGDEHGKKMSKSKGNAIDPLELMKEYGTDALRFTLCDYATQDQHIAFSVKRCEGYRNFMNKLWNAARLIYSNIDDLSTGDIACTAPVRRASRQSMALEDRWIVSRYATTVAAINEHLDRFAFDGAVKAIYDFFWKDFCDYYLELAKQRLYCKTVDHNAAASRTAAQGLLTVILEGALRLLHPFAPFITEELWSTMREHWGDQIGTDTSLEPTLGMKTIEAFNWRFIMMSRWNDFAPESLLDPQAEEQMTLLREVIYTIRNIRGEMKLQPGMAANVLLLSPDAPTREVLTAHGKFFSALTNIRDLRIVAHAEPPSSAATAVASGVVVYVELPAELREQEALRLQREIARVAAERKRQEAKLSNESFTSKAPPAVVDKERQKLEALASEHEQLEEKLKQLG